jgi:hypothetical protein
MTRALALLVLALTSGACAPAVPASRPSAVAPAPGLTRHVVVFKYKPGTRPEQIREVTQAFGALREQIPGIVSFEHGVNNSPEALNMGFTHAYVMTFVSPEARDAYLPHPAHRAFGDLLGRLGILESAFVVDYTPQG